ncbi:MAG: 4-aminobutyrate--2-oxoglutarate transaminase [Desulfarculaceae bacterium]|jgi:4-aminobutyrate aminotransferase/(S)-3-amino-2-methylpropionate transaminase
MTRTSPNALLKTRRESVVAQGNVSAATCYVAKARGAVIIDVEGREYIDFAGGIAVMNVGHSHPAVVAAIQKQAQAYTHTCFMVAPYEPAVSLAEKLCAVMPGEFPKAVMLANSGAEAVENAVKIARRYTGKQGIVAFDNAFHGRTLMGMSLTSKVKPYKLGFGPYAPEIYRIPFAYCYRCPLNLAYPSCGVACADCLEHLFAHQVAAEQTAAVMVEPIQGEGGFIVPPAEYFQKLKEICETHEVLFIADEIQTGFGRTGTFMAMEHYGVAPDLITVAKSMAAGMPLSAVVGRKEVMDGVHPAGIGGTYGGNPVACAAALAVFDIFEQEDLLTTAVKLGESLETRLGQFQKKYEIIGDVRGVGPMMAMELVQDRQGKTPAPEKTKTLTQYCFEQGLIVLSCGIYGNVVRFLMPLVITPDQLEKGLDIIEDGLKRIQG